MVPACKLTSLWSRIKWPGWGLCHIFRTWLGEYAMTWPETSRQHADPRISRLVWKKRVLNSCPKTVDSPNTVLQKITGGIFCTQFVQCNDGGAGGNCMFLSVFTYSSNPLTQICEIVQLTRWAHRKFPQHFLPSSRHKKHGECLLLLLACKFRSSQHVNLKLWLFHVIGVKRYREAESVHWGSETVYVSSPAKLHDVFEFQHSGWFPPPAPKRPLWHRRVETFDKVFAFVWTVLLVTLAVCVTCVCNLLKFQPELCFTWRILRFAKVRKLSKFTKWSTGSAALQWY